MPGPGKSWAKGLGPRQEHVKKVLSDGEVHYVEDLSVSLYGDHSHSQITGIRMAINDLRKAGYQIVAEGVRDTKRKRGYRMVGGPANA